MKKIIIFATVIIFGVFSIVTSNVKKTSVDNLLTSNVEALTQRTWDGRALAYSKDWNTGTCGVLGFCDGGSYGQYYQGFISYCHGSESEINLYRKNGASWIYMRYCCDSCSSTSYCNDN